MLIAAGGFALLGSGCAGNTDEATNVGAHSAQLNGHGTANSGPAYSYFEYWKTASPADKLKTPTRNWPAGAQGSISELPQHLSASTAYSYRLCGGDQDKNPVCTSAKHFSTGVARSHLDYNGSDGRMEFDDDPGVNSNLSAGPYCFFNCGMAAAISEIYCTEQTCGSRIVAPDCESQIESPWGFGVRCGTLGTPIEVKLGDLDDVASVRDWQSTVTMDGGPGDDSLNAPGSGNATLTGGTGRDVLTTGGGNDTINARSATYLYPDTDGPISCGGGDDTVIADRSDPISSGQNGCEHVSKL
jgi:hypothetical protein